jgi:hypothetical protein
MTMQTVLLWTLVVLSGLVSCMGFYLWLDGVPGPTGLRTLLWNEGRPASVERCGADSTGFAGMVDETRVWMICPADKGARGTVVVVDLPARRGVARWELPLDSPVGEVKAFIPAAGGAFALVYRTAARKGRLVVGIGGEKGWLFPPSVIPVPWRSRLVGAGWKGRVFDAVVVPSSKAHKDGAMNSPLVFPFSLTGRKKTYSIPMEKICKGIGHCNVQYAYRSNLAAASWHVLMDARSVRDPSLIWSSGPAGPPVPLAQDFARKQVVRGALDNVANGVFEWPRAEPVPLQADGRLGEVPSKVGKGWRLLRRRPTFLMRDGRPARQLRWWRMQQKKSVFHDVDAEGFNVTLREGERGEVVVVSRPGAGGEPQALVDTRTCPDFSAGLLIAEKSGWLLLGGSGCYLTLSSTMARSDGLNLAEILARDTRSSVSPSRWLAPAGFNGLIWGFVLALLVGLVFGRASSRRLLYTGGIGGIHLIWSSVVMIGVWDVIV